MLGNSKEAITATPNVPSRKTMASVLSLILTSLLRIMSNLGIYAFLAYAIKTNAKSF
jgi:hypothetical protein